MTAYACMPRLQLNDGTLSVCAVQPNHIEHIRQWRNKQTDILRQTSEISPEEQIDYYAKCVWPEMRALKPKLILLAYMDDGVLIGYGGLVHIAWEHRRAEVSFLLDPKLTAGDDYVRYFSKFLGLMKALAFDDLGLERLHTETYAMRRHHISILEAAGFRLEGRLKHHVWVDGRPIDSLIHGCLRMYDRHG